MGKEWSGSAARQALSGRRVLVVEDEFYIADDLERAVHAHGGEVVGPVASCDEALDLIHCERIDVAIVDINLQGTLAYPLVDELTRREVPVLFAIGYCSDQIPPRYRHLPRWVKPYLSDTIAAALKELVKLDRVPREERA